MSWKVLPDMTQVLTEAARFANWGQPCKLSGGTLVEIYGKNYDVYPLFAEAWEAWEFIRAVYDYDMPGSDTGHYSCRHILHDDSKPWSEHAWRGLAFDMNWLQNPWTTGDIITDMPPGMTTAIQRIRTLTGEYVFRWGGDWDRDPDTTHSTYDAMHFSITASRADMTGIDWSTVEGGDDLAHITEENQIFLNGMAEEFKKATHPKAPPPEKVSALSEKSVREFAEGNRWFFDGAGVDLRNDTAMAQLGKDLKAVIARNST